jgi:glutaredoxin/uncharacterized membrane protein
MIRILLALLASVLTAAQSLLIYTDGKVICFNGGCEIVDSLTTVPTLYFDLAGFIYFFTLFCCLSLGRAGGKSWMRFARLLLLAGLAAEAVLIFFQYAIAQVFCSYCLIILGFIVLLNVLCGLRQIFNGVVIMAAVLLACFSLNFTEVEPRRALSEGVVASLPAEEGALQLQLFFSSSCPHCEDVIEFLKEDNSCAVSFHPVERLKSFTFPGAQASEYYHPEANLDFMKSLGLTTVPVLIAREGQRFTVVQGGVGIRLFLEENCRATPELETIDISGMSSMQEAAEAYAPYIGAAVVPDDNCEVDSDCLEQGQDTQEQSEQTQVEQQQSYPAENDQGQSPAE